eukprot:gene5399-2127_t
MIKRKPRLFEQLRMFHSALPEPLFTTFWEGGGMSSRELRRALAVGLDWHYDSERFDELFAQVDIDGDGTVTLHELLSKEYLLWGSQSGPGEDDEDDAHE